MLDLTADGQFDAADVQRVARAYCQLADADPDRMVLDGSERPDLRKPKPYWHLRIADAQCAIAACRIADLIAARP